MQKIAVISCWFGPYPNYFGLWIKSVAWNPTIDFYIVGNTPLPPGSPANLHHLPMTLEGLQDLIRKRLDCPSAVLPNPYKCCDYKPMYGLILGPELNGYDFWGHCDLDLVFGNLRAFLTEERLGIYDKFYPNGHLSVYRNTPEVNDRWRLPYAKFDVNEVISSPLNFAFDEWDGIYNIYMRMGLPFWREVEFCNPAPGVQRFRFRQRSNQKYERSPENYPHQCFYWENGNLHRAFVDGAGQVLVEDYVYMHFFKRHFPNPPPKTLEPETAFFCTPSGFVPKESAGVPSPEEVMRNNPYRGKIYEWLEDWWMKKRRKIRKLLGKNTFVPRTMRIPGSSWRPAEKS